jgi:CheY-like chemotaxis protein
LRQHGYCVRTAATGPEATELVVQDVEIGVVICDFLLHGFDGLELLHRTGNISRQEDGETVKPPIILLMISPTPRNEREVLLSRPGAAQQMGFGDVFVKPLDRERLLEKLNAMRSQFMTQKASKPIGELGIRVETALESEHPQLIIEVRGELEIQIHRLDAALEEIVGPEFLRRTVVPTDRDDST